MCIMLHIPLQSIYAMSDEDYHGIIDYSYELKDMQEGQISGKSYTRKPTGKELMLYNKMKKGK